MSVALDVDDSSELSVHAAMISDAVEQAQQHGESINELFEQENEQSNHGSMFRLPKLAINQSNKQPIYSSILAPSREDSISCCARVLYDRIVQSASCSPISQATNQSFGSSSSLSNQSTYQTSEYNNLNDQASIDADPFDISHFARTIYQTRLPTNLMTSILSGIPTVSYRQSIRPTICPCPSLQTVQSFIQHVFNVCHLSIECTVIAVLYIDRLESIGCSNNQPIVLHVRNWMPLLLTALLSASKVWDDQSSHNADFVQVLPGLTIKHLNHLEREFLSRIQYELYIASSEYARYFFAMRDVKTRQEKLEKLQLHRQQKRESLSRSSSQNIKQTINQTAFDLSKEDAQTEQDREIDALTRGMKLTKAELEAPRPIFRPKREMPMSL